MLSEVFWSFFLTSIIGCIMGILKMLYKSKCKTCFCCGIKIERDINAETEIDELTLTKNSNKENVL